ncbi:MAG: DUF4870 domain-containing protein [Chloroflexota bacterium]|jgi:uncharacterized membrane protein|nr:DUF4870 domain-containing protein [Chloroflexota bacterium]
MTTDDMKQEGMQEETPVQPGAPETAGQAPQENTSPTGRAVDTAREQASEAADALRHGEFMREAVVDPEASSDDRLIALLSYITQILIPAVMPIIVLLSASSKQRPFQRYHAVQSLALTIVFVGLGIAVVVGTGILQIVPVIGWLIGVAMVCLTPIGYLMAVVALLYYGYQAYQGKRFSIPGLTSFLRDQGWL